MQADGLARVPQKRAHKSEQAAQSSPTSLRNASLRANTRVPQKCAHTNEQAAQSSPTSLHNASLRASPGTTKTCSKMSKLPNPALPPAIIQAYWLARVPSGRNVCTNVGATVAVDFLN